MQARHSPGGERKRLVDFKTIFLRTKKYISLDVHFKNNDIINRKILITLGFTFSRRRGS